MESSVSIGVGRLLAAADNALSNCGAEAASGDYSAGTEVEVGLFEG